MALPEWAAIAGGREPLWLYKMIPLVFLKVKLFANKKRQRSLSKGIPKTALPKTLALSISVYPNCFQKATLEQFANERLIITITLLKKAN